MSRKYKGSSRSPYRRDKTSGPAQPEESETFDEHEIEEERNPALEPGQMAQLIVDMRKGVVDKKAANSISGPLKDLASAFAMQAEILRGVHENQKQIADAIKDDKKSDVVVNSTKALNETFRGVRSVQEKLLDELDDRGKHEKRSFMTTMVGTTLLVVTVIAGFIWLNDSQKNSDERKGKQVTDLVDGVVQDALRDKEAAFAAKTKLEIENRGLQASYSNLESATQRARELKESAEKEAEGLRREQESIAKSKEELVAKISELEQQVDFYVKKYEIVKQENERLRVQVLERLRSGGVEALAGRPKDGEGLDQPIVNETTAAAAKKTATSNTEIAAKKTPTISADRVLKDLNTLLANHRGSHVYAVESIGNVSAEHLQDVVVIESSPGAGVIKRVRADKLEFVISAKGDMVELNFKKGDVRQRRGAEGMGAWTPFYNDRYRMTVYCLNGGAWLGRNYGFLAVD